ncbi:unnamed protein product [Sympodiomycopsis kandeliae]
MSQPIALFGLKVSPGEVHRIDVTRDFKISNVSFGAATLKGNARAVVKVHITPSYGHPLTEDDEDDDEEDEEAEPEEKEYEERSFVLCTLTPGKIEQASVDIAFSEEEEIGFSVTGDNEIDVLGNYLAPPGDFDQPPYDSDDESDIDPEDFDEDDEDYDSEEAAADGLEDILNGADSEDDEDSSRFQELGDVPSVAAAEKAAAGKKRKAAAAEPEVDADVSMSSAVAPVSDAELAKVAAAEGLDVTKLSKAQRKRLNKKLKLADGEVAADTSVASAASEKPATRAKESVKTTVVENGKAKTAAQEKTAKDGKQLSDKRKLPSGLIIEVKKQGDGPAAKKGSKVGMRYIGKLTNGKVFDSNTKGKPFSFKLGRGEVIKGWDEGVAGMKIGEERRLTCPPQLAYGSRGAPPDIPRNATLVFDVKLCSTS